MKKYDKLAKDIVKAVGGEDNVNNVTHCFTRLRFKLKDEGVAETEAIKNMDGVVSVIQSGGQYQVVIGNNVADVYESLLGVTDLGSNNGETAAEVTEASDVKAEKVSFVSRMIDLISGIFQPILGMLAAMGVVKGLTGLLTVTGLVTVDSGTHMILNAMGDALFYFFPIFLGQSAMKKFGGSQIIGGVLGAILVYPAIAAATTLTPLYTLFEGTLFASPVYITFFGIPVILMSYASSVIPIVMATALAAPLERRIKASLPSAVNNMLTPFFTIALVAPLALLIVGPIATWLGMLIGEAVVSVYNLSPVLAGALVGGLWQVLVIFGLHWGLVPIMFLNHSNMGYDPIITLAFGTIFAQIGAVLAIAMKTKDKKLKTNALSAFFTGVFGITEPAIYGVTLPRKKTFIYSCVSAAIAGMIIGFFGGSGHEPVGIINIFILPTYINPATGVGWDFYGVVIGMIVAFVFGFGFTLVGTTQAEIDLTGEPVTDSAQSEQLQ